MRRFRFEQRQSQKSSIAVSLAVHVIVIALIASITFRYPLAALFGPERPNVPTERLHYVTLATPAARAPGVIGNGSAAKPPARKKASVPAPLVAPAAIPSVLPPVPAETASVGAISGKPGGTGGAAAGVATGVEPAMPDARISLAPSPLHMPLTIAERNDSAVKAIYYAYRQAEVASAENRGRSPRDWTFTRGGKKFGLDSQWVYLGKFKLPSAILAALPFNYGGVDGARIIQARNADWIREDIYEHSQGMSEDDFRAAVKRIRERVDREHREAEAEKEKAAKGGQIVP